MRVVGGRWAGRNLTSPSGRVRPTMESLRDRWLGTLAPEFQGGRVLDLFAGSGALGIEAMSRGARYADFVEHGPSALHALKANVAALRIRERTRIFKQDAIAFIARLREGQYDVALADPPYGSRQLDLVVARWREVAFAPVLSIEHAADQDVPPGGTTVVYGEQAVTTYRAPRRG